MRNGWVQHCIPFKSRMSYFITKTPDFEQLSPPNESDQRRASFWTFNSVMNIGGGLCFGLLES
jgi:hypothetical protein